MVKILLCVLCLVLFMVHAQTQELKQHSHNLSLNYLQINEEMNHGLVFRGPGLNYSFSMHWQNTRRVIDYEALFGFSYLQSREIGGGNINFIPVKLDYLLACKEGNIMLGPFFIADYNYELYPDLQSGYSFWFTNYSLGGMFQYKFNISGQLIKLSLNTSLIGFTSRQVIYDDPYFFDLSLGYIVQYVHQDFKFGSWSRYNRSELEIQWHPRAESRLMFAYVFNYHGYYMEPNLSMVNQSIKLIIRSKLK